MDEYALDVLTLKDLVMDEPVPKFRQVKALKEYIEEIEDHLDAEMLANDQLNDANIKLKEEVKQLREKLKVVVHPNAMENLQSALKESEKMNKILRDNLNLAADLLPKTEANLFYINHFYEMAQKRLRS